MANAVYRSRERRIPGEPRCVTGWAPARSKGLYQGSLTRGYRQKKRWTERYVDWRGGGGGYVEDAQSRARGAAIGWRFDSARRACIVKAGSRAALLAARESTLTTRVSHAVAGHSRALAASIAALLLPASSAAGTRARQEASSAAAPRRAPLPELGACLPPQARGKCTPERPG